MLPQSGAVCWLPATTKFLKGSADNTWPAGPWRRPAMLAAASAHRLRDDACERRQSGSASVQALVNTCARGGPAAPRLHRNLPEHPRRDPGSLEAPRRDSVQADARGRRRRRRRANLKLCDTAQTTPAQMMRHRHGAAHVIKRTPIAERTPRYVHWRGEPPKRGQAGVADFAIAVPVRKAVACSRQQFAL